MSFFKLFLNSNKKSVKKVVYKLKSLTDKVYIYSSFISLSSASVH